jgi:hypothetical protein
MAMTSRVITQANHQKLIGPTATHPITNDPLPLLIKIYSTDISAQKDANTLSICLIGFTYSLIHQSRHNFVFFLGTTQLQVKETGLVSERSQHIIWPARAMPAECNVNKCALAVFTVQVGHSWGIAHL